ALGHAWIPIMILLGFASGLCNEHTGPAVVALAIMATIVVWRRDRHVPAWAIAGIVAMIAGGLALYFAPGQSIRYNAVATQASMLRRIADRDVMSNLRIVFVLGAYLVPTLAWILLGVGSRIARAPEPVPATRRWTELALVAAAI